MSPADAKGIAILVGKLKEKAIERVKEKAHLYTQAKSKWVPEKYQEGFEQDLLTGALGIDITKPIKKTRSAYEEAIKNAKSIDEIEKIKQEFGAK